MASSVVSDNFETSTGAIPQLGGADITTRLCSAWVNFNGTGTVAINASYNVSSITDNGTGNYTANLTNAMTDINYSVSGYCSGANSGIATLGGGSSLAPFTTSTILIRTINNQSFGDMAVVCVSVFR